MLMHNLKFKIQNSTMDYTEVSFKIEPKSTGTDILIAELSQIGYESFVETDEFLQSYIPANLFNIEDITGLNIFQSKEYSISFQQKTIKDQNWNEVWESNFSPVLIKDMVYIRAPFHAEKKDVEFEIVIEPKMSFGTAHHETTSLMIEMMLDEKMSGKSVLDMGCGTGILAILSEILGASNITAVDNDEWAFENVKENIVKNKCKSIVVQLGDADSIFGRIYDFILANINRNILLQDMAKYAQCLGDNGVILFSGFYDDDLEQIKSSARKCNLKFDKNLTKNNWVAARFVKTKKYR